LGAEDDPGAGRERDERQRLIDLLRAFSVESQRLSEAFAEAQRLHPTDLRALLSIMHAEHDNEPLTPRRLGEDLGLSSGAVTAVVDRLERAGHLFRSRDDPDRRVVHLHYDPRANAVARQFFGPLGERSHAVMDGFTPEQLGVVALFVAGMTKAIADFRREIEAGAAGGRKGAAKAQAGRDTDGAGHRGRRRSSLRRR
jgi:DNA-binding MarR family transcriptional regulator